MEWFYVVDTFIKIIGFFVAFGGGVVAIAFMLFRFLGKKWINKKFEEQISSFKHEQHKELERLKHQINKLMDRAVKLHQKEFDVIPEAWSLMNDAYHNARVFASPLQSYPNIKNMTEEHFEEFISDSPLEGWQKGEIRQSKDRQKYYREAMFWYRLWEAKQYSVSYNIFLKKNGIFMPPDLLDKFQIIANIVFDALQEIEFNKELDVGSKVHICRDKLMNDSGGLVNDLHKDVQSRFWESI